MLVVGRGALALAGGLCLAGCAAVPPPQPASATNAAASAKVTFDVSALGPAGLSGKADAAVAVSYEFCIPAQPQAIVEVQRIDRSARCTIGPRGRVGCTAAEALCLGSTGQAGWLGVLDAVAALPYVKRIDRSFGE